MEKEMQTTTTEIPAVTFDEFEPTSYETWKEAAVALLKGAPFEKKTFDQNLRRHHLAAHLHPS